jgi:DNA-binding MarR family transcriptional regulator
MDSNDIRTLKILEEIENDHTPSQRDLAQTLNVSLGLVNSFIKRLAHKGYFKITSIPKNRVKYILTPKGAAEKTRLTYEFIQYSFQFYKESRKKIQNLFKELAGQGVGRIAFYGVSDFAEIAYLSLQEADILFTGIFDNLKNGQKFLSFVVMSPDHLLNQQYDRILITDLGRREDIKRQIIDKGIAEDKIVTLE